MTDSRAFTVGLPCAVCAAPFAVAALGYADFVPGEHGLIERMTVLILAAAIVVFALTLKPAARLQRRILVWTALLGLGAIYFAGEEVSWGQWLFGWRTPEYWGGLNDQQETNLHNLEHWGALLDQLPRLLLTLAALVGVLAPAYRWVRDIERPPVTDWAGILPTAACAPAALLALSVRPFDKFAEGMGDAWPAFLGVGGGELKECMLAMFILMYACAWRTGVLREARP